MVQKKFFAGLMLIFGFSWVFANGLNLTEPEMLEVLYQKHLKQLKNTELPQISRALITFSCVPGMGKTYVANQLEEHYKAVCVSTNEVRELANEFTLSDLAAREKLLQKYMFYFLQRYDQPNRFFVLDASVDRSYIALFPYLENNEIPCAIIRLEVPRDVLVERIHQSKGEKVHQYLKFLDRWFKDYEEFGKNYQDYIPYANELGQTIESITTQINDRLAMPVNKSLLARAKALMLMIWLNYF